LIMMLVGRPNNEGLQLCAGCKVHARFRKLFVTLLLTMWAFALPAGLSKLFIVGEKPLFPMSYKMPLPVRFGNRRVPIGEGLTVCNSHADALVTTIETLNNTWPFITSASLLSDDVTYEGPLESIKGRSAYINIMQSWQANLPMRLESFQVSSTHIRALKPGEITCTWSCSFLAPLPPTAKLRGLANKIPVFPGDLVPAELSMRSHLHVDSSGRITRQSDAIVSGFDVVDAIARYEFLSARRPDNEFPAVWYWKVLRLTTFEELSAMSGGRAGKTDLENQFTEMIVRNLGYGILIGIVFYALLFALVTLSKGAG